MAGGLILFRKDWKKAIALFLGVGLLLQFLLNSTGNVVLDAVLALIISVGFTFVLVRFGVVALIVALCLLTWSIPVPVSTSAWSTPTAAGALALLIAAVVYGFYRSLAGKPLLA